MSKFKHFLGIDVSKEYFDAVVILDGIKDKPVHNQFVNDAKGNKSLYKWLINQGANSENTLVCLEHTGMYGKLITNHLISLNFSVGVEMSLRIMKSIGVQRGKNDKVDAERIADYAMKNVDEATIYIAPSKTVDIIKRLLSLREKLVATKTSLMVTVKELKAFDSELSKFSDKYQKSTIKGIDKDLKKIEIQLAIVIKEDENVSNIFKNITSVPSIGKVTALLLICLTNEFSMYSTPRKLVCYSGVVPFERTSGNSIRSKPRVHYIANKNLKKHLHMCALSALKSDPEIKAYYQRKVAEGKSKMLVINNIRNKPIHRICACIRDNKIFEKKISA